MRIVQMTSVHDARDVRVFNKMSASVASAGHEVHLIVPKANPGVETIDGVIVHGLPLPKGRIARMFGTVNQVLDVAAELQGDLYQFHDPELLRNSVNFQEKMGVPVVYDSHEDYRLQMKYKYWLPRRTRTMVAAGVGWIEDRTVRRLAGVIAATPSIAERFSEHPACVVVQNFPLLNILQTGATTEDFDRQAGRFGYVGALSVERGAKHMVDALAEAGPDISLELGGEWYPRSLRDLCAESPGWKQVNEQGYMDRAQVAAMFRRVFAGLALLHPVQSYLTAYSTKMFEYMAGGLPVIASDFPVWRSIVDEAECGLLVDPLDPVAIGRTMRRLADDPDTARVMGANGRRAIEAKYNWISEQEKLLVFYDRLVS